MDLHSRMIFGWPMQPTLARDLVQDALVTAVWRSKTEDSVIVHFVQGNLAKEDVFEYIEMFYNRIQRHGYRGGVGPEAVEAAQDAVP